jgi:uncharacterized protein YjbI with pentapeptide repeats
MAVYRGPRPYNEADRPLFFGRDREIEDIADLVERNRLAIVTAPSGVGKTSVLLAGVVPKLRQRHREEIIEGGIALGPTLICRSWLGRPRRSAQEVLFDALVEAIGDLGDRRKTDFLVPADAETGAALLSDLERDVSHLQGVVTGWKKRSSPPGTFLEFCSACADGVQRLVLVFDQFEDALRLPVDGGRKLLRIISTLFHQEARIRLLLSFRQEFIMRMHDLEVSVGGLLKRTYYLQAVSNEAVDDIVIKPAAGEEIDVRPEAAHTLKGWLLASQAEQQQPTETDEAAPPNVSGDDFAPPLLALQALLVDIYEFLVETNHRRTIDNEALDYYKTKRLVETKRLAHRALEHHVDKVVSPPGDDVARNEFSATLEHASATERDLLLRRLFARMPAHLTSGSKPGTPGYKNQVRLSKLLKEVLFEELRILNIDVESRSVQDALLNFAIDRTAAMDLVASGQEELNACSGLARRAGWSYAHTAEVLVISLVELLGRLVAGNILKPLGNGEESAYELVHDGLGPAVQSWADEFKRRPADAVVSLTKTSGVTFRWPKDAFSADTRITSVFWQGCDIAGLMLEGVTFNDCDLRGTVFRKCVFVGGGFERCNLDGAIFIECLFFSREEDVSLPCTFKNAQVRSVLFSRCVFEDLLLTEIKLDGSVFAGTSVPGRATITNSSLEVAVFRDCVREVSRGREFTKGILISNCDFIFSRIVRSGKDETATPVYLDMHNNVLFPGEPEYFTGDPPRTYSSRAGLGG